VGSDVLTAMTRRLCHGKGSGARAGSQSWPSNRIGLGWRARGSIAVLLFTTALWADGRSGWAAALEMNPPVTMILTVEGKVEAARRGTQQWLEARTNQVLAAGDRLRTGLRSRATLRLSDLSVLRVNELTTLEIQPPPQPGAKAMLDLRSGATYLFNRERPTEIQFRTPLASGAIRGTEFNLAVAENGRTELTLLDGEVSLSTPRGDLVLQSGEQGVVEPGQAPRKTPALEAINIIQWVLYYPAVVDPDEISFSADEKQVLAESLAAYRSGDLLKALEAYPENRPPVTDADKIYHAALLLAVGQVQQTEALLNTLQASSPLAQALREVFAAVKGQTFTPADAPTTGSEWIARSYYWQSRSKLDDALKAAREAVKKSPNFGAAWIRLTEMEFCFAHTGDALKAVDKGLELSPRNAQGLALKGFLLSARRDFRYARLYFELAIATDGALGNAWLGRGLLKIRSGHGADGRADLQVAATLEPQRSLLRSYLGKAWSYTHDAARAAKELDLAKRLDPNDPTPWLYSALLDQQYNRINEAVGALERSKELNDNRSVYRSRLLLDQDRAVRSANLAAIYRDAGMFDVGFREASRAVSYDYGNYSAHLFLAESYDAFRDPRTLNLRYETPFFSELLVSQLLAPVGGGNLSQNVSQQEYSRLFDSDHLGVYSETEYFSSGDWVQYGSQYGTVKDFSYAIDVFYSSLNGYRPNNDLEQLQLSGRFKQQITPSDSVFLQASYYKTESGDILQYYNQDSANPALRIEERQEPNLYLGYHHEWAPGVHTLLLGARLHDRLEATNPIAPVFTLNQSAAGDVTNVVLSPVNPDSARFFDGFESEFVTYSAELQQIWQHRAHTLVVGGRVQIGDVDTDDVLTLPPFGAFSVNYNNPASLTNVSTDLDRYSAYAYYSLQVIEPLQLTAGLSYDYLNYPVNTDYPPLSNEQTHKDQLSPKAGFISTPWKNSTLRFAFTRSLGGLFYDNSVRLEPTQLAGFTQAYRSLIPESVVGPVPGSSFETFGFAFDQKLPSRTYLGIVGELLCSSADRTIGAFTNTGPLTLFPPPVTAGPSSTQESLDYVEKSLLVNVNQLIGNEWALGARYRLTHADLDDTFTGIPAGATQNPSRDVSATLNQLYLYVLYTHSSGLFSQFDAIWTSQSNHGYTPDQPGDDFWQYNFWVGWRLWRRQVEARVGVLNLSGRDYNLNPLTLYTELPRQRTLALSLKFYF
jgi:predicted Zn-dependent protease